MIGIIGGSGVYEITQKADSCTIELVKTDYGDVEVSILNIFSKKVAFIPRHAKGHSIPPHKINFRANIDALKKVGVTKTVMLTGDRKDVAEDVGRKLGIDEVISQLLPADKVERVEKMLSSEDNGSKLAFVGDGINDAPVLMRADVGIAMGSLGSDAAIEAADIVIMDDDINKIPKVIGIARKTIRIVKENIVFALSVKVIILILGALGLTTMWLAVFGDVGVAVIAILNSMRALRTDNI